MHRKTILLVEDNADDEALTLRALKKSGIATGVVVARDGAEALDLLFGGGAQHAPLPDLVLLDLNLPKVGGLDVLRKIRGSAVTHRLPVVILTSSAEERDLCESYDRGANSYVRKPVDSDQFNEAVLRLGLYWLAFNSAPPLPSAGGDVA